ncbi:leucine Rich Repeat domain-containing protein [Metarhizium album ARSEF 1941]|uniref:Leucine Rich Repeat domain-containing protein n=1 Tax=Metarhizium album (strain ARSEF 1941) TaxID=1081103 RepID=A0A0B2WZT0_METAS|nr:leucine Rich Repeat domain-containing protein [Metarhizium album ARSEF 1941]KHN99563.1 leucine Rich Repeat domain-containing protein [Metarhizium album ARSEF 1941]
MSGMSALWNSLGIGASISAARTERQKAALQADLKYLYSAFTKIPCLRLAPDWRARLISGYEEFPFDSAVPIHVFKNLQALEINSIDFRQFFGWDRLADQLRSLSLRHAGIEDPADILIDIVLDDMDKRRRRTSKSQSSPTTTWAGGTNSPRRSPTVPPELVRAASAPGSPEHRTLLAELRRASMTPNEPVLEDSESSDTARPSIYRDDADDVPRSPSKVARPRSISPTRPASSRHYSSQVRSSQQRIRRSGSGSSHSSLSESWHHHARGSSGNLLALGILPASKWRFLRHLSLADNAITSVPSTSLAPLSNTLYSLDLSSNLFSQIPDSLASLTALRALNLSHCMIDSLQSLTRNPLPAITALNLRANRLQSLAGIEKLYPLERLDLRDNRLCDPLELARLTGIPDIREIWLDGNPFTRTHKDYRVAIFNIFRSAPGCTEDIIIDGHGPSYSEKRLLTERAPIPDSVPVVKQTASDTPVVVDVSTPAIVYNLPRDSSALRKERVVAKAVTSEVNINSSRRRKVSKRRIVDLATGDSSLTPTPKESFSENSVRVPESEVGNYRITAQPGITLLPPVILTDSRKTLLTQAPAAASIPGASANTNKPLPPTPLLYDLDSTTDEPTASKDWDASGEMYRRKIEALRDRVGSGYLSVLSEESWDGTSSPFISSGVPSVGTLRTGHVSHHVPKAQAIHSGRTMS